MTDDGSQIDSRGYEEDSWPWDCLNCDMTIYHDGPYCRDCETTVVNAGNRSGLKLVGPFIDWMKRESYLSFVTKVTVIAGIELGLTAVWLHLLISRSIWEVTVIPVG